MLVVRAVLAGVLLAGCAGTTKSSAGPPSTTQGPSTPGDLEAQIARSSAVGRQLYVLDKVAAIATDAVLAEAPDPHARGIAGYVPIQEGDADGQPTPSFVVSFFTRDVPPRIAYEVRVTPDAKPSLEAFSPPKEVSAQLVSLIRARQLAIASMPTPTQPLNPVLLPGEAIGEHGILIYLLAGTTKPGVAVLGRHFRALVSDDGTRLVKLTPLSNAALEIPTRASAGATVAALTVTHVVTDFPLETHVFTSLLTKLPIYVGTARGLWRVDGDKIQFLGDHPPGETQ